MELECGHFGDGAAAAAALGAALAGLRRRCGVTAGDPGAGSYTTFLVEQKNTERMKKKMPNWCRIMSHAHLNVTSKLVRRTRPGTILGFVPA